MPYSKANREAAKEYTSQIRSLTKCENCGGQPIEWHSDRHLTDSNLRIAHLTALGFPIGVIQAEIDNCEALCRRCHMKDDGRTNQLAANIPRKKGSIIVGLLPCKVCGKPEKPLRRGHCNVCYKRHIGQVKTPCPCLDQW